MASCASSSSRNGSYSGGINAAIPEAGAVSAELDDYFYALFVQSLLISEDRDAGQLGKQATDSDIQVAIDLMLQEAEETERSLRLAKILQTGGAVPEDLLEELSAEESLARSDRELALRLSRGEPTAESSLQASTTRFHLVHDQFQTLSDCCSCSSSKQSYIAPCGHAYCEECAVSLYNHSLTNRAFIPVRCCQQPFAPEMATACLTHPADIAKYETIRNEIEHPCPPPEELDIAASRLITEKGWKVCPRCGAVVERAAGCVHMTCICRHEFCYTCMRQWKTCRCELYPTAEINQILNERIGNDDAGRDRHRLQNVLRNYYQHDHEWERQVPHGRVCNVCQWNMPLYCMHCNTCRETRCFRCCFNR